MSNEDRMIPYAAMTA